MKFLRMFALALATTLTATAVQAKCATHVGQSDADPMSLVATPSALSVATEGDARTVTTLGTIANPSGVCFTELVVEIQYFDVDGKHVDTVVQQLPNVVSPAGESVDFRTQGVAAKDAKAYATQRIRVVDGSVRWVKQAGDPAGNALWNTFMSWAPMLLLICVWVFFVLRQSSKKSPQAKLLASVELQTKASEAQVAALLRIAAVLEKMSPAS